MVFEGPSTQGPEPLRGPGPLALPRLPLAHAAQPDAGTQVQLRSTATLQLCPATTPFELPAAAPLSVRGELLLLGIRGLAIGGGLPVARQALP